MLRATTVLPAGSWASSPVDTVTLDFDHRHRRRLRLTCDGGLEFLLDLPKARSLAAGEGLALEDGRVVQVKAAPEKLAEIGANTKEQLVRLAWHLGNRHLPTEIYANCLRIRYDHVIVDMVQSMGADVKVINAPFNPEGGAYGHGRTHGHDHDH